MKTPEIPEIKGVSKISLLEMNSIHIEKNHTVLTPQVLESLNKSTATN